MEHNVSDLITQLADDIREDTFVLLQQHLPHLKVHELVDLFDLLSPKAKLLVFRLLDHERAADLFAELAPSVQQSFLQHFTDREITHLLEELQPDQRTQVFEEMPGKATQRLLNLLPPEELEEAKKLLGYPDESVGRLMTPHYVAVRTWYTCAQALEKIRKKWDTTETSNVIYVVDQHRHLKGVVSLRELVLATWDTPVHTIMLEDMFALHATDDREEAVRMFENSGLFVLPVVNRTGVLLGIVTADDIFDVATEETTEDFHVSGAVLPLKQEYTDTSIGALVIKRTPWLFILVVVNLISSGVISIFEETLQTAIVLAFFIPLLIGTGWNAGAQSATIMVRAIATGDVKLNQWGKIFAKEIVVSLLIGAMLGIAGMFLWLWRWGMEVSMVVWLSMIGIVMVANCIGVLLPFLFTKIKQDPAIASGPLITSVVDATGLLIYFGLASLIIL